MTNVIETSVNFSRKYKLLGRKPKSKINSFMAAFQMHGFNGVDNFTYNGYKVRNKPSNDVPTDNGLWLQEVNYATSHKLWHFHLGFYDIAGCDFDGYKVSSSGDLTSQWMLHYQKLSDSYIRAIDISPHPFSLPTIDMMKLAIDET